MYDNKFVIIDNFMKHVDKNIYFRNINNFIDCVKNIIDIKKTKIIRQNLYICFRETTLT